MGVSPDQIRNIIFDKNELPGQMVQSIIGGEAIQFNRAIDMMSISYVHPLVITILGMWAIGRAGTAIAGEIDRGTMELLLAQPIRRTQIVLAPLLVDAIILPTLCLAMWTGTNAGTWLMELNSVNPMRFLPALPCLWALLFAISGVTIWLSSMGRSRGRVWGGAICLFLVMFLINVLGQIWTELEWLRPLTVYYYFQPQAMILSDTWYAGAAVWLRLAVLAGVGLAGYALAWLTFTRRDLPAPL
jgi:ABC-2 type transport system permease protein